MHLRFFLKQDPRIASLQDDMHKAYYEMHSINKVEVAKNDISYRNGCFIGNHNKFTYENVSKTSFDFKVSCHLRENYFS